MSRGHGRAIDPHDARHDAQDPPDPDDPHDPNERVGDSELLRRVRASDETSYGELWARHARAARRVAAGLVPPADVEDIVSEAFERTLAAIRAGNGPHTSFAAYVAQTMRTRAATMYARRRLVSLAENDEDLDTPVEDPDPFLGGPARERVVRAFHDLPPRWQDALWVSVVEAEPPRRVAARLGTSPNGVSALVIRARRRLRANFIDLSAAESRNPLCSKAIAAPRHHAEHLNSCDHCGATMEGLAELDVKLNARGAGPAAILAVSMGSLRVSQRWARNAFAAAPAKAVAAVVAVVTAGAALTPFVVPPSASDTASPARSMATAAPIAPRPATPKGMAEHLGPSPVGPTWSRRPAARHAATPPSAHRPDRPQPTAPPTRVYPGSSAPMAPADAGSTARTPRPLSLDVRAVAACACARIRVRGTHRPDVVRVRTHQKGAADSVLVLHPAHPGVLHVSVPRSAASSAPMIVTVSVTRRRTQTLEARAVVRALDIRL